MAVPDIMDMPAMEPPSSDILPNYDNPPNQNGMVLAILSVCLAVSCISVSMRVYSRWDVLHKLQLPDYLLLASFGIYVAILGLYYRLVENPGWFVHQWDLRLGGMVEFLRVGIISTCMLLGLMMAIKTAILVEWIRIFLPDGGNRQSLFFWLCHFIIWSNVIFCIVMLVLVNLSCVPYEYLWNRTIEGGYCRINTAYTSLSAACWAFSTDIIILLVPQHVIWKLNMTRRRRLGVSVVFALGVAACAASIVRLYYTVGRSQSADLTYHLSSVQLTAVGEGACVILVMCVPALPKAVAALRLTELVSSLPSWENLVSVVRRRPSHPSFQENADAAAWPPSRDKNNGSTYSQMGGSGSERNLVALEPMPGTKQPDQNLELGNAIVRSTKFETREDYDTGEPTLSAQNYSRQHPWMKK